MTASLIQHFVIVSVDITWVKMRLKKCISRLKTFPHLEDCTAIILLKLFFVIVMILCKKFASLTSTKSFPTVSSRSEVIVFLWPPASVWTQQSWFYWFLIFSSTRDISFYHRTEKTATQYTVDKKSFNDMSGAAHQLWSRLWQFIFALVLCFFKIMKALHWKRCLKYTMLKSKILWNMRM